MSKKKIVFFLIGLMITAGSMAQKVAQRKPNVILFLVDDLGWMDVGYNGSKFYETPNIDKLSKESVRFNQAYAACHVCSPTRASIMSGKYPARINLTDWLPGRKDFPFQKLKNVTVNQHLPFEEKALPVVLKENGYRTAIFGKWHLSEDTGTALLYGFDQRMPEWNVGWPLTYFPPYKLKGLENAPKEEYLTDRLTTEALKYIETNKDQPFFLYLAHFAVHDPIEGRPDLVEKYKKKLQQMKKPEGPSYILEGNPDTSKQLSRQELNALLQNPQYAGHKYLPNRTVKVKQYQDNVQFAAMVEAMDESMGRVMAKLKDLGIDDNTIIIFASDNGGMAAANYGKPERVIPEANLDKAYASSNLPLRGAKGWFYEGGIRVPMLIRWPAGGMNGLQTDVPVISTDYFPTILEMAGLPLQPKQHMDGVSLAPLVSGKKELAPRALYWHFPHYSNHGQQSPGGAIRYGDYKLLEYYENGHVQLFNIKKDPGEQNDLVNAEPAKVKELKDMLHAWRKDVNAKMMPANPMYTASH
jgi:arylsulfatase A-like enzyme